MAMNNPETVQAEVIETDLATTFDVDFDGLSQDLTVLNEAVGSLITDELLEINTQGLGDLNHADTKRLEQSLNKKINAADEARKQFNRDYDAPKKAIKERYDAVIAPAIKAHGLLKTHRLDLEKKVIDARLNNLSATYSELFPALSDVVPFERLIEGEKWANYGYKDKKAEEELVNKVTTIATDWNTLEGMKSNMPFFEEAEREFFRTLSIKDAIALHNQLVEESARIEAMKDEVKSNREFIEQDKCEATEPITEPDIPCQEEDTNVWLLAVEVTPSQIDNLVAYLKSRDIHGALKRTSFATTIEAIGGTNE